MTHATIAGGAHTCLLEQAAIQALPAAVSSANPHAVALGGFSLAVALLTPRRVSKFVPSSLLALVAGTAASFLCGASMPLPSYIIDALRSKSSHQQHQLPSYVR